MFLLATKSKKEYTIYIEGGIFLKKLLLFLISFIILFSGCSSEPPLQIPESKPEPEKEEFVEPFDDWVPFANYPTEPSGYYHFFKDFAVDFPAGWYKSLNRLVQAFLIPFLLKAPKRLLKSLIKNTPIVFILRI